MLVFCDNYFEYLDANQAFDCVFRDHNLLVPSISSIQDPAKCLEVPLMCRSTEQQGMIDSNFNRSLLKLFQELYYWERLNFEVPHFVQEVYNKRLDLRTLRENVLLVVRDYNRIIAALSSEERNLFRERIKNLDKKIHPGITKLTWASKGMSDYFINDCRLNASRLQHQVDIYKDANIKIGKYCKSISESLLIKIDSNRVYENTEFNDCQVRY